MINTWMVSDTHFYHSRVMEFCSRTRDGKDSDEMSELMIARWNKLIKTADIVYHVGDFCFRSQQHVIDTKNRLNGRINLILGNHDHHIAKKDEIRSLFESVSHFKRVKIGEHQFDMSHTPQAEWVDCHKGAIHIHGHLHGNKTNVAYQQKFKIMDVGIDTRQDKLMHPYHIDEVLQYVKNKKVMTHH